VLLGAGLAALASPSGLTGQASAASAFGPRIGGDSDAMGQDWEQDQPALTPTALASLSPTPTWHTAVTGQVYGTPVLAGGVLVVVTEADWVYGLAPTDGHIVWQTSIGTPVPSTTISSCSDITPTLGITSTPVVDPTDGTTVYVAGETEDATGGPYRQPLVAINATTGAMVSMVANMVPASTGGSPVTDQNAGHLLQRPALTWVNGTVLVAYGSHCDVQPYQGEIVQVDTATLATHTWISTTDSGQGGIWMGGGGITSDGSGRAFVSAANTSSSNTGHFGGMGQPATPAPQVSDNPPAATPQSFSQSVVDLALDPAAAPVPTDWFTPTLAETSNATDKGIGPAPVTLLPDAWGTGVTGHPHLAITATKGLTGGPAGKNGAITYLLDRDNLGHRVASDPAGNDGALASITDPGIPDNNYGGVAIFDGSDGVNRAYIADSGTSGATLRALTETVNAGVPALSASSVAISAGDCRCGRPEVTSVGGDPASATVWTARKGAPATSENDNLQAYAAVPTAASGGTLTKVWQSDDLNTTISMQVTKFSRIGVDDGLVVLGGASTDGTNGVVAGWKSNYVAPTPTPAPTTAPATATAPPPPAPSPTTPVVKPTAPPVNASGFGTASWKPASAARISAGAVRLPASGKGAVAFREVLPTSHFTFSAKVRGAVVTVLDGIVPRGSRGSQLAVLFDPLHHELCLARDKAGHWVCTSKPVRLTKPPAVNTLSVALSGHTLTVTVGHKVLLRQKVTLPATATLTLGAASGQHAVAILSGVRVIAS
jgi:hypothetical protein